MTAAIELKTKIDFIEKIRLEWDQDRDHQYSKELEEVIAPLRSFVEQAQRVVNHGRSVIFAFQSEHVRRIKAVCDEPLNQLRSELSTFRHEYRMALETFIIPTTPCADSSPFSSSGQGTQPLTTTIMRSVRSSVPTALVRRVPTLCTVFDTYQSCRDEPNAVLPDNIFRRIIPMILKEEPMPEEEDKIIEWNVCSDEEKDEAANAAARGISATAPAEPETTGFGGASRVVKEVLELELTASKVPLPPDVAVCSLAMLPPDVADLPSFIEMIAEPDSNRLLHGLWSIRKLSLSMDVCYLEIWPAMTTLLEAVSSNVLESELIIVAIFETICTLPLEKPTDALQHIHDVLLDGIEKAVSLAVDQAQEDRTLKMAASVSHKLVGLKPYPSLEKTRNILESLAELVRKVSEGKQAFSDCVKETLNEAFLAVSHIACNGGITALLETDLLSHVAELLHRCDDPKVQLPALRVIGDEQTQAAIDSGFLSYMGPLLRSHDRALRKEAVWILSNIAAGSAPDQIQAVIDSGLLAIIVQESLVDTYMPVRKEAVHIFRAMTSWSTDQIASVIQTYPVLDKLREAMNVFGEPHSLTPAKKKVISLVLQTLTALFHQNSSWRVDFDSSWMERFEELDDHTSCQILHGYIDTTGQT